MKNCALITCLLLGLTTYITTTLAAESVSASCRKVDLNAKENTTCVSSKNSEFQQVTDASSGTLGWLDKAPGVKIWFVSESVCSVNIKSALDVC